MSHAPERKEKDCLNCGTIIHGRFCHVCGQENIIPKDSFWKLVIHFFYDITHFDSKFFDTLKYLVFRPGFLPKEYIKGRRAAYLNPIRMYIFTSAFFFLIFFSLRGTENAIRLSGDIPFTSAQRDSAIAVIQQKLEENAEDIDLTRALALLSDTTKKVKPSSLLQFSDSFQAVGTFGGNYSNIHEYDSIQNVRPESEKDGWFLRMWNRKAIALNEKYREDPSNSMKNISSSILHKLPYLLFISLPFFALILRLLYVRRRKEFYYADHGIFSIHHYIFSFILMLFIFLWGKLDEMTTWGIWEFLTVITIIAWPVYLYIAMKKFYKQGIFKTFFKFLLLNLMGLIVLLILFAFFILFSIFQL